LLDRIREQALRVPAEEARRKWIFLELEYDPDLIIRADLALTVSALQNLTDNAVKFTDSGRVSVTVEDRPTEVVFHVRDTCEGLSPEELRSIFEPFRRAHWGKPGTGLGLAIARRSITAQGGTIDAESKTDGAGCHFWFTLPRNRVR